MDAQILTSLRSEIDVQGHCHRRSIMKFEADEKLLKKIGLEVEVLDAGCCGMAGAFGFEKEHYDVSIACRERVLLPHVRASGKETLIVADGLAAANRSARRPIAKRCTLRR